MPILGYVPENDEKLFAVHGNNYLFFEDFLLFMEITIIFDSYTAARGTTKKTYF